MNAMTVNPRSEVGLAALKWTARALSVASVGLLLAFAFGGHESVVPQGREWVLVALFPIGVAAGMVLGWWRTLAGGLVTALSLAAFYAVVWAERGAPAGPYFAVFALPGLLFLAHGLLARWRAQ